MIYMISLDREPRNSANRRSPCAVELRGERFIKVGGEAELVQDSSESEELSRSSGHSNGSLHKLPPTAPLPGVCMCVCARVHG